MIYCTIHAYSQGDVDNIYRGVDGGGHICGDKDAGTLDFPYVYFYNPTAVYTYRMCVDECPELNSDGTTITTVKFWDDTTNADGGTVTWDIEIDETGEFDMTTVTTGQRIGYDSILTLDRVCVPDPIVLSNAF